MLTFTDQLQRKIQLPETPRRIISLVPSQTELLFDLGLNTEVVGITKFCLHPEAWFKTKTRIGGTKQIDFDKIKALQPDLIIGNKEENEQSQIEELMSLYPVWMSDISTIKEAYDMMTRIGVLVGKQQEAVLLKLRIESGFYQFQSCFDKPLRAIYFIWNKPLMVAGADTFIDDMMRFAGFDNVCKDTRYPEISEAQLADYNPEVILLSSEPFPFKEQHIAQFKLVCPLAKVVIVDGELFSWYGSRLLHAPGYFKQLQGMFA